MKLLYGKFFVPHAARRHGPEFGGVDAGNVSTPPSRAECMRGTCIDFNTMTSSIVCVFLKAEGMTLGNPALGIRQDSA